MSEYKAGDKVVLPPYGVGIVAGVSQRSVAGTDRDYYQVDFPGTRSKAFVPVESNPTTRLRRALTDQQIPEILGLLREGRLPLPKQWAARHRKTTEVLANGDPFSIATLAGQLRAWENEKGLPDLDRQALRRAMHLLSEEVSQVLEVSTDDAKNLLEDNVGEASN